MSEETKMILDAIQGINVRLDKMEKKTMTMLTATGAGVMVILLLSILQTFTSL